MNRKEVDEQEIEYKMWKKKGKKKGTQYQKQHVIPIGWADVS